MNKLWMTAAMAAAAVAAAPVAAAPTPAPTIIYMPGSYGVPAWTTATVFQTFQSGATTAPGISEKVTGTVQVDSGLSFGGAAAGNNYLSIGSAGTYTVSFASAVQYFSFDVRDLVSSDKLILTFANGSVLPLLGTQIAGAASATASTLLGTGGRVNIDLGGQSGIKSAQFTSTSIACDRFLIDNLASAAPEPGTWGLMIVGVGLAGAALRRRRGGTATLAAA